MRARGVGGFLAGVAALSSAGAVAHSTGITGHSGNPATGGLTCTQCHSGGTYSYNAPAIVGAASVEGGSTTSYTLNFTKASGVDAVRAGFNLSATGGTLLDPVSGDVAVRKVGTELTHGAPRPPSGGNFSWSFNWTAPTAAATYKFYVCNNPVNLNGANTGDGTIRCSSTDITVTPAPPTPPVANDDSYSVTIDKVRTVAAPGVLANDTDVNGDTLTAVLGNGTTHGTLTLNDNGSFTYTPEAMFEGVDTFTYQAFDGSASSNIATVTLTVAKASSGGGGGSPGPVTLLLLAFVAINRTRLINRLRHD